MIISKDDESSIPGVSKADYEATLYGPAPDMLPPEIANKLDKLIKEDEARRKRRLAEINNLNLAYDKDELLQKAVKFFLDYMEKNENNMEISEETRAKLELCVRQLKGKQV